MLRKLESPNREICIRACMCLVVLSFAIGIQVFLTQNKVLLEEFFKAVDCLGKALVLMYQHMIEAFMNFVGALLAVVTLFVIACKFWLVWSILILMLGCILGSSWNLWTTCFTYAVHVLSMFVYAIKRTTGFDIYEKCTRFVFDGRVRQSWSKFFENKAKEQAERPPHPMDGFGFT